MSSDTPAASEQPHAKAPHTPAAIPAHGADPGAKLTRAGALWTSLILGFLVLILLRFSEWWLRRKWGIV